jgi:hypothetical protein
MSLFQRRHFRRIAEIAARMRLNEKQKEILVDELRFTNSNFNAPRFRNYMSDNE